MGLQRKAPLRAKKPWRPERKALKRTEFARTPGLGSLKRTQPLQSDARVSKGRKASKPADDIPQATRDALAVRSGGRCEARATRSCTGHADHAHHRQRRRTKDHRLVNLLHCCWACHALIHAEVAAAYVAGFLVRSTMLPETVPVRPGTDLKNLL